MWECTLVKRPIGSDLRLRNGGIRLFPSPLLKVWNRFSNSAWEIPDEELAVRGASDFAFFVVGKIEDNIDEREERDGRKRRRSFIFSSSHLWEKQEKRDKETSGQRSAVSSRPMAKASFSFLFL